MFLTISTNIKLVPGTYKTYEHHVLHAYKISQTVPWQERWAGIKNIYLSRKTMDWLQDSFPKYKLVQFWQSTSHLTVTMPQPKFLLTLVSCGFLGYHTLKITPTGNSETNNSYSLEKLQMARDIKRNAKTWAMVGGKYKKDESANWAPLLNVTPGVSETMDLRQRLSPPPNIRKREKIKGQCTK